MSKKEHLKKFEKAIAEGKADKKMIPFCKKIMQNKNYYTTSSCSGRIGLFDLDKDEKKREKVFHKKWHTKPTLEQVWKALQEKNKYNLWFKQEPLVLVIGTNSLENAKKILQACNRAGIKRANIMHFEEGKILVEIMGTHYMSFLAKEKNKILIDKKLLKKQLEYANKKLEKNWQMLERFEKEFRNLNN